MSSLHFQLPLQPIYQKSVPDSLKIQYVTQRILASVLPRRETPAGGKGVTQETDKHEKEVIAMLAHKHGKVITFYFIIMV